MNTIAEETFSNVHTVKAFNNEDVESERFRERNLRVLALGKKRACWSGLMSFTMTIVFWSTMVGICYYAYTLYVVDKLSIGKIMAYLDYMILLMLNFGGVAGVAA